MAKLNAADVANSWSTGVTSKGKTNYTKGVTGAGTRWKDSVSAPEAKAAWESGVQEAINSNSWQNRLDRVNANTWEQAATTRGADNYASNTPKAKNKYQQRMQPVLDVIAQELPNVRAMPKSNFEEAMARSNAMARALYDAKRAGRI